MASKTPDDAPANNARPARAPVIRATTLPTHEADKKRMVVLGLCVVVSILVHGALVFAVAVMPVSVQSGGTDTANLETSVIETKVEENVTKPPDLENEEVGLDPEVPTNYDNNRKEEVSVPGMVNVDQAVGIPNAPEDTAKTLPPPPGFGGGSGGGVESSVPGTGALVGLAGGLGSGKYVPGGFAGRSGSTRDQMVKEGGGNNYSEAAVARGIKWVGSHQAPDGHWSLDGFHQHGHCNCTGPGMNNDIAATAFGLLPLLGAGQTHKGGGMYAKNVERGLTYLMAKQDRNGDFGGGMYAHGLATIAMCEAYGLTSDPRLKRSAQSGLNFIVYAQGSGGGWDYSPRTARNDTSVGGWQLMGIKSGQMAGLEVPTKTLANASRWLDKCASPDGGGYGYGGPGETPTMSAVGLLCREYLGWGPRNPGLAAGVNRLCGREANKPFPAKLPDTAAGSMYFSYYATQVMHHFGGEAWEFWNPKMRDQLIAKQEKGDPKHPHQIGSWAPSGDAHGGAGGRIMITSLSLLTLEVYYRHLPLYRREMGGGK